MAQVDLRGGRVAPHRGGDARPALSGRQHVLYRRQRLVFGPSDEAEEARNLLVGLGVPRERIGIETRSRNTDENARFSAAILHPQPGQVWLVVTSAFHMPRSMGLFRKAGFDAVAYPVDFRTFGDGRDWRLQLFRLSGLSTFDLATHEWTGLLAYYLAGKIGDLSRRQNLTRNRARPAGRRRGNRGDRPACPCGR